jgi:hypothetical protein
MDEVPTYQAVFQAALHATVEDWRNPEWICTTMKPVAELLERVVTPCWQQREPVALVTAPPKWDAVDRVIQATTSDALRVWARDRGDPYFPVAALMVPTGDDHMDGSNFLNVLCGMGAYTNKNMCLMMSLLRCFLMANPRQRRWVRKPYAGIAEPMRNRLAWMWHRTAFYDGFFFEQILNRLRHAPVMPSERERLLAILENLVRFIVVQSREWLISPNEGVPFPAITCLPQGGGEKPVCRFSKRDWKAKKMLGFGDYVPDTDTTFVGLAVAQSWLDFVAEQGLSVDSALIEECEVFLARPWVGVIHEFQFGSRYESNLPTIQIAKPLDYYGAVPIWFDKPFPRHGGEAVREVLGNEICPGHNMDILDSILRNRHRWRALEDENLEVVHRLLEFHHRAYVSGNFRNESTFLYYLPEIYVYYTGRFYETVLSLDDEERALLDPSGKIEEIRRLAIEYVRDEMIGATLNPFDAALALSALVLLRYPSREDGMVASAFDVLAKALGEGRSGHPYKAYEWNRMRHPTRIVVGSEVATSLFVMNAAVYSRSFFFGQQK